MIFGWTYSNGALMMTRRASVSRLKWASELVLGDIIHLGLPAPLMTIAGTVSLKCDK